MHTISRKRNRLLVCGLLLSLLLVMLAAPASAASPVTSSVGTNEVPYESYTYWNDLGGQVKTPSYSKPVYAIADTITANSLGIPLMDTITDICADEKGNIYLLDASASKIHVTDNTYHYLYSINTILFDGEPQIIDSASGIFVKDGKIYVADTNKERVLVMDEQGVVQSTLTVPESSLIPEDFIYRPKKITVDSKNYTYVSCDGSYYGALVYSPTLEFLGFYGANTVPASVIDVLSNFFGNLFSNDAKRDASTLRLPYQFVDMVVGPNDFIYTVTGRQSLTVIATGQVSVMNPGGKNILTDSTSWNFLDTEVGSYNTKTQVENALGVDVDADGFFYIVDATYGRVFWYDEECNLLGVFGGALGTGTQRGTTYLASAIVVNGTDVLVCDGTKNSINVFRITEYGKLLRDAQMKTLEDDYEGAIDQWHKVLDQDQNSQLAYRGLAKGYYALGDNEKAAEYAKLGVDRDTYSNAFEKLRTAFLEKWFALVFVGVILVVGGLIVFAVIKRKKNLRLIRNEKLHVMLSAIAHPFESFRLVKEKGMGSVPLALLLLALYYIMSAISDVASGFAFNNFNASTYNSFYVLLSTVGLVVLWTVANWLVCVLLGGIGKLKEIFIVTCYSLMPVIFSHIVTLILTHLVVPDEFVFVSIFQGVCLLYTFLMLIVGTMKVHDFGFGRFLGTTVLTLLSMLIIVFLMFLIILLAQQVVSWLMTLYIEIRYR